MRTTPEPACTGPSELPSDRDEELHRDLGLRQLVEHMGEDELTIQIEVVIQGQRGVEIGVRLRAAGDLRLVDTRHVPIAEDLLAVRVVDDDAQERRDVEISDELLSEVTNGLFQGGWLVHSP